MRRLSDLSRRADAGRASIEFVVAAVVLFIPVLFVTQSLWLIQAAAFATEQASRDATRVFVQHTDLASATRASETVARHVAREHGITQPLQVTRQCRPAQCLTPGALVQIRVTTRVTLWQVPVFRGVWPVSVPVHATSTARVSGYGGAG